MYARLKIFQSVLDQTFLKRPSRSEPMSQKSELRVTDYLQHILDAITRIDS
jgi:hypothetical protein